MSDYNKSSFSCATPPKNDNYENVCPDAPIRENIFFPKLISIVMINNNAARRLSFSNID